jgi:hypothetical protein
MNNSVTQAVMMWQMEALVAVALLLAVYLYHKGSKVWRTPDGVSLIFILGAGLAVMTVLFFVLRDRVHWFGGDRNALFFLLLYCWCALGTVFVAARQTHGFKLFIGLMLQAVIVYSLYKWI